MAPDPRLLGDPGQFHGPSPILGPDGRPYRKVLTKADESLLGEEVATAQLIGTRAFYEPSVASGLTPSQLGVILASCVRGDTRRYLQLAEDMEERDLAYRAALGTRKRALSRIKSPRSTPRGSSRASPRPAGTSSGRTPSIPWSRTRSTPSARAIR